MAIQSKINSQITCTCRSNNFGPVNPPRFPNRQRRHCSLLPNTERALFPYVNIYSIPVQVWRRERNIAPELTFPCARCHPRACRARCPGSPGSPSRTPPAPRPASCPIPFCSQDDQALSLLESRNIKNQVWSIGFYRTLSTDGPLSLNDIRLIEEKITTKGNFHRKIITADNIKPRPSSQKLNMVGLKRRRYNDDIP